MGIKKAIGVTVLAGAMLVGGYVAGRKVLNDSNERKEQKIEVLSSIDARLDSLDDSFRGLVGDVYQETKVMLRTDPEFRDEIVGAAISNNPGYALGLIPEDVKAAYVSSNYQLLSDEAKDKIAIAYIAKEFENKKGDFVDFVKDLDTRVRGFFNGSDVSESSPGYVSPDVANKNQELIKTYLLEKGGTQDGTD